MPAIPSRDQCHLRGHGATASAATDEEPAITRMREVFAEPVRPRIRPVVDTPEAAHVRAVLIGSQVVGLAVQRYILRMPPVVDMTADQLAAWVGPSIQRYVTAPAPGK